MVSDIEFDYSDLIRLSDKLYSLGGSLNDSEHIKAALRDAGSYLSKRGKSNLRARVKDKANWQIINWFVKVVFKKNKGVKVGFDITKMRQQKWRKGEHHGMPWWLDQGTRRRWTKSGHYTGAATPNFFWEDVKRDDLITAVNMVTDALHDEITRLENK